MSKKLLKQVNWGKVGGLIPVIIQDCKTLKVLMLGYMNREALGKTLDDGKVWFYSRTRQELWLKGKNSGNFLMVIEIFLDCDQDTLLVAVKYDGSICHTGMGDCFGQEGSLG